MAGKEQQQTAQALAISYAINGLKPGYWGETFFPALKGGAIEKHIFA